MLISTTTVAALRCPTCGKMDFYALSLFALSGQKVSRISCSCGASLLTIGTKDLKSFWFQVDCIMCETKHLNHFTCSQIWSDRVLELDCEETGVEIGFIGPMEKVKASLKKQDKSLHEMAQELGLVDFFEKPEIMYEVLDCLHHIADNGNLSCHCGNYQINIEIFPERLELQCERCGAVGVFYAESEKDLETVRPLKEIYLTANGWESREGDRFRRKRRHTKK